MNEWQGPGLLALATGACAAGSAGALATFFAVGGPFSTINDVGNAATGVLSGWLAWRLRRAAAGRSMDLATGSVLVGAALTVVGSWLVVSGTTGFLLAGLVSSLGFAGIGWSLVAISRDPASTVGWPPRLRILGIAAGSLMALGVVSIPGVLLRIDDMGTAPGWVWLGLMSWLGTYVAFPVWAIWFGVAHLRPATRRVTA